MTHAFQIASLTAEHDRAGFSCGVEPLDRYFRQQVTQDIRRRITNCFVALDPGGPVAGCYTFASAGLPLSELPPDLTRKLPRYKLLPAGLVGRLAVDTRYRGAGLGSALVADAALRAMRADPAIFALVVEAKDETALAFYRHFGFQSFAGRVESLFLPIASFEKAASNG